MLSAACEEPGARAASRAGRVKDTVSPGASRRKTALPASWLELCDTHFRPLASEL